MKTTELLEMMAKAGQKGGSELNMRSEDLQQKQRVSRIKMLKKDLKKKAKELLILEIALPFNPETGEEDDVFNSSHKFRPPVSATSAALIIKKYANEVPKTKEVLMKRAGITEWDTSDPDTFTATDRDIFKKYRVPRLFTINVVSVNIPAITKDRTRDYAIKVDRDPNTGDVIGEWPVALKINKLFRDTLYEEAAEYKEDVAAGRINHTEDQQKKYLSDIYKKNPVSDDHPKNWVELIEIPLDNKFSVSADFDLAEATPEKIKECRVVSGYSKKIREKVEAFKNGDLVKFDNYFDFIEIDMACPNDGDTNSNQGKMQIGQDTAFDKPTDKLVEQDGFDHFNDALIEFLDSNMDVEKEVLRSVYVTDYNDELEQQLVASLKTVYELDNKYCTEKVLLANKDIISIAFDEEGLNLIDEADAGVSGKTSGGLNEESAQEQGKAYDLSSADFTEDDGIDLSEISLDE